MQGGYGIWYNHKHPMVIDSKTSRIVKKLHIKYIYWLSHISSIESKATFRKIDSLEIHYRRPLHNFVGHFQFKVNFRRLENINFGNMWIVIVWVVTLCSLVEVVDVSGECTAFFFRIKVILENVANHLFSGL